MATPQRQSLRQSLLGCTTEEITLRRQTIFLEILQTEENYVRDLQLVGEYFLDPIRKKEMVGKETISKMFSNWEEILTSVNQPFLLKLQTLEQAEEVGWVFLEFVDLFKMYAVYCSNQARIGAIIEDAKKESPELKKLDDRAQDDTKTRNQGLRDFLILPMQRICRYPMLLENLSKYIEVPSLQHDVLNEALFRYKALVAQINEYTRRAENVSKLTEIERRFVNGKSLDLVQARRSMIWEGRLKMRLPRSLASIASSYAEVDLQDGARCFLFDDLLISCAPQDIDDPKSLLAAKYVLDLSNCFNVHVEPISDDQNKQGEDVGFEVVFQVHSESESNKVPGSQKKFKFKALTSSERDVWVKKFRELPLLIARRDVAALSQLNHHLSISKEVSDAPATTKTRTKKRFERKASMQEKRSQLKSGTQSSAAIIAHLAEQAGPPLSAIAPIPLPADRSRSFAGDPFQNGVSLKLPRVDSSTSHKALATARPSLTSSGNQLTPQPVSPPTTARQASHSISANTSPMWTAPKTALQEHAMRDRFHVSSISSPNDGPQRPAAWTPSGPPKIPLPKLPPHASLRFSASFTTYSPSNVEIGGYKTSESYESSPSVSSTPTVLEVSSGTDSPAPKPDSVTSPRVKSVATSPRLGVSPPISPRLSQTVRASSSNLGRPASTQPQQTLSADSVAYGKFSGHQLRNSDSAAPYTSGPSPMPLAPAISSSPVSATHSLLPPLLTTPLFGFSATSPTTSPTSAPDSFSTLISQQLLRDFESVTLGFVQCLQMLKLTPNADQVTLPINGFEIENTLKYVEEESMDKLVGQEAVKKAIALIRKRLETPKPVDPSDTIPRSPIGSPVSFGGTVTGASDTSGKIPRLSPSASLTNLDHLGDLLESIASSSSLSARMPRSTMQSSTSLLDTRTAGAPKSYPELDEDDLPSLVFEVPAYGRPKGSSESTSSKQEDDPYEDDADEEDGGVKKRKRAHARRASLTRSISDAGVPQKAKVVASVNKNAQALPSPKRASADRSPRVRSSTIVQPPSPALPPPLNTSSSSLAPIASPRTLEKKRSKGVLFSFSESSATSPHPSVQLPPPPNSIPNPSTSNPSSSGPVPTSPKSAHASPREAREEEPAHKVGHRKRGASISGASSKAKSVKRLPDLKGKSEQSLRS